MAATVLLAPLEVLKLRVQTSAAAASEGALRTLAHIVRHEGIGTRVECQSRPRLGARGHNAD